MDDDGFRLWARIHVRTGLSLHEFYSLDMRDEVPALLDAMREKEEQEALKRADLYATIYRANGQNVKPEDFLGDSRLKDEIEEAKLDARAASIRSQKSERAESEDSDGEGDEDLM